MCIPTPRQHDIRYCHDREPCRGNGNCIYILYKEGMMKRFNIIPLVLVILLVVGIGAFASDITGAEWRTQVVVTNNSTAASAVSTNFTLSTANMITAGMLNATATDAAMTNAGGADIAFMPGRG